MIPLAALIGVMFVVAEKTFEWGSLRLFGKVPREDIFVGLLVGGVTIIADLAIAVIVGVIVSALTYAWKSSNFINIEEHTRISDSESKYKLKGTLFFGSINKFKTILSPLNFSEKVITLDCSESWIWDQSSVDILGKMTEKFKNQGKVLNIENLGPSSRKLLEKGKNIADINIIE